MAGAPHDPINISLRLSEVLSDIGVNEEMVLRRRNTALLKEALNSIGRVMTDGDVSSYYFGSQSEGTTTIGINSDIDELICDYRYNVIQQWAEWKPNVKNILMIQDESTSPGYCKLQRLCDNAPLAATYVPDSNYVMDSTGRILLKNTKYHHVFNPLGNYVQHGPAATKAANGFLCEEDTVPAFHCESWPKEGRHWLHRRSASGWPSLQIKTECERSGCFLVPVGSNSYKLNELEWRISTSHAERYLMFTLNLTHLHCYVLMKMLLKSHINRGCDNVISSYMCKTAMLHCAERTSIDVRCRQNLLVCLNQILLELYHYVLNTNCPHFIIPENNLMANRISPEQQQQLLENIRHVMNQTCRVLFYINTDHVGTRLQMKMIKIRELPSIFPSAVFIHRHISGVLLYVTARYIIDIHVGIIQTINNEDNIPGIIHQLVCYYDRVQQHNSHSSQLEQEAYKLLAPLLCSTIGSVLASYDIRLNRSLSGITFERLKLGLNSDVSSGWLKLATVYYSTGDVIATERILRHVEQRCDGNVVQTVCACHIDQGPKIVPGFKAIADRIYNDAIGRWVSYCVIFMRCEGNIVPDEMQQEFYRSTQEEKQHRSLLDNKWMNFAVVDSLPYLYFLQYKTYGRLRNRREQEVALQKLEHAIRDGRNFEHKETAWNLLGQCKEQENQPDEAFSCYERSLLVRPQNNAARFHRARILSLESRETSLRSQKRRPLDHRAFEARSTYRYCRNSISNPEILRLMFIMLMSILFLKLFDHCIFGS